jgi:hypothetical protein
VKSGADPSFRHTMDDAGARPDAGAFARIFGYRAARLAMGSRLLITGVCGWSLIEAPAEFDPSLGATGLAALVLAKVLWIGIGIAALRGFRRAQWLFSFLCGLSLVAIVPGLPVELNESLSVFAQSVIECMLKGGALLALSVARSPRTGVFGG